MVFVQIVETKKINIFLLSVVDEVVTLFDIQAELSFWHFPFFVHVAIFGWGSFYPPSSSESRVQTKNLQTLLVEKGFIFPKKCLQSRTIINDKLCIFENIISGKLHNKENV